MSFRWDSVKANIKGSSNFVSSIRMGILAIRPVVEIRPAMFAKIKDGFFSGTPLDTFDLGNGRGMGIPLGG